MFRNMTLWGCRAREIAAVTSVGSNITEQPRPSLPTGQTNGIVPQSRLHWRRPVSTATEVGALQGQEKEEDEERKEGRDEERGKQERMEEK